MFMCCFELQSASSTVMDIITFLYKGSCMNCVENIYIQLYQHKGVSNDKWNAGDFNPMYEAMHDQSQRNDCRMLY